MKRIIDNLDVLGNEKYKDLIIPFQKSDETIRKHLAAEVTIPKTDYVIPLKELGKQTVALAGGKLAYLGELAGVLGLAVPPGFVVTTYAYQSFIQHNQIRDALNEKTSKVDIRNYDELTATSQEMQELVRNGQTPADLETARGVLEASVQ